MTSRVCQKIFLILLLMYLHESIHLRQKWRNQCCDFWCGLGWSVAYQFCPCRFVNNMYFLLCGTVSFRSCPQRLSR